MATFIDMAKAFDTVNHKVLIEKKLKLGFKGKLLELYENYLNSRTQVTMTPVAFHKGAQSVI